MGLGLAHHAAVAGYPPVHDPAYPGIQRKLLTAIRLSVTKDPDAEGEVSQFATLTTALASTIGTGNIIGVGTSIALGGPGAVFWCWITGIFGIATKYAESLIAVNTASRPRMAGCRAVPCMPWNGACT